MTANTGRIPATFLVLAGLLGACAVGAGAYASHGLARAVGEGEAARAVALWTTASHYQMVHAGMLVVSALLWERLDRDRLWVGLSGLFFAVGSLLFPGALYALGWWGCGPLAGVAPLGGISLILGWLMLCVVSLRVNRRRG